MNNSLFYKMFPVPAYMDMDGVGIDIAEDAIRFVKIISGKNGFELKSFGEYPIPEGSFSVGKIHKMAALSAVLSRVGKEHHIKFAHAALSESQAYLVEIEVSTTKNSELRESIELQLEEHVPLAATEAVFDYQIAKLPKGHAGMTTVLVSAAPRELILSYSELFYSSGIKLLSLETDAQVLARAVVSEKSTETVMIVNLSGPKIGVYVKNHGSVQFSSDIDLSWKNADFKEQKKSPQSFLEALSDEINRSLVYWHAYKDKSLIPREKINRIILCGEGAIIPELPGFLSSHLHIPVEMANVWVNLFSFDRYIPKMTAQESFKYATAIGLAIRSGER